MKDKVCIPPIKSQGIKTKLVPWIRSVVPEDFNGCWIEPFMGTAVVGLNLAPKKAILSDSNPHLIRFYNAIKTREITPSIVREFLKTEGEALLSQGEKHYYEIRERFNSEHHPLDFLFLNRAGFNGMIRFNRKGGFNIPFCRKPNRFAQSYVTKIVNQVAAAQKIILDRDFSFKHQSFIDSVREAGEGDIIYCDPPYIDRHVDYFNSWNETDEIELKNILSSSPAKFILSTWHSNTYRENKYIQSLWSEFKMFTTEHFYHVGASESNRNPMTEALITNLGSDESMKNWDIPTRMPDLVSI